MTPQIAGYRLLCSLCLGAALGVWYGFLRPLRPRHTALSDGLFVLGAVWIFLVLGFQICRGDIRMGYFFGMLLGMQIWENSAGRGLRPVFYWFWRTLDCIWKKLGLPVKKVCLNEKVCVIQDS